MTELKQKIRKKSKRGMLAPWDYPLLQQICWFLNLKEDELNSELDPKDFLFNGLSLSIRRDPAMAKRVQDELRQDLLPIIDPKKTYKKREAQYVLRELVRKIDRMKFTYRSKLIHEADDYGGDPELYPVRREPRYPILGHKWRLLSSATSSNVDPLYSSLYRNVIEVIETGELSLLKLCSVCQKFFTQLHGRQTFCSDQCRNDYNNRRRLETGYFSELRRKKRQRELAKARKLSQEGKSPEEVVKEIPGLTLRILRRKGLVPKE